MKRTLSRCDFRLRSTSRDFSCLVAVALALLFRGISTCEVTQQPTDERAATPNCPLDPRPSYQFPFLRYDEDWSYLRCAPRTDRWDRVKYMPLGEGKTNLTIGGDVREVYESYDHQYWGDGPQGQGGWLVHHYLLHGDLHVNPSLRVFGELQAAFENGRNGGPRPYDEDKLDIHQAFVDFNCCRSQRKTTLRIGRQELYYGSGRLVDARFGLNTRISFDGLKIIIPSKRSNTEIFATRPTLLRPGIFDDPPDSKKWFWGIYNTTAVKPSVSLDLYYLGYKAGLQTFATGVGEFQSNTIGGRWAGKTGNRDFDEEANVQVGTFKNGDIRAWSVALYNGYTFQRVSETPRVSLRSDATSGDNDPNDRHLGSFFPLYARGKYFGEADLNGPVNTIDIIPALDLHPRSDLLINLSYGAFWRESIHDGIYGFAGNLYKPGDASRARMIGQQAEIDFNYFIMPHTLMRVVYQHFFPGRFLKETPPGQDVNYVTVWFDYHF